jgi:hypothetical protein
MGWPLIPVDVLDAPLDTVMRTATGTDESVVVRTVVRAL